MTELYEAYCVEQGDEIILKGQTYKVMDIHDGRLKDYAFRIMDEEGYVHEFEADFSEKVRVIVNPYVEVE